MPQTDGTWAAWLLQAARCSEPAPPTATCLPNSVVSIIMLLLPDTSACSAATSAGDSSAVQ